MDPLDLLPVPALHLRSYRIPTGAVLLAFDLAPTKREARSPERVDDDLLSALTPGQRRVTLLALEGRSDEQIAAQLGLSRHTVSNQLRRGYSRLGVNSRSELSALVCRARLHCELSDE